MKNTLTEQRLLELIEEAVRKVIHKELKSDLMNETAIKKRQKKNKHAIAFNESLNASLK